jgi:hypothetical protein
MKKKVKEPFTELEDTYIYIERRAGTSYTKIANWLGRSRNSIIGRWHRTLKKELHSGNGRLKHD